MIRFGTRSLLYAMVLLGVLLAVGVAFRKSFFGYNLTFTSFPLEIHANELFGMYGYDNSKHLSIVFIGKGRAISERVKIHPCLSRGVELTVDGRVIHPKNGAVSLVFLSAVNAETVYITPDEISAFLVNGELFESLATVQKRFDKTAQ